MRGTTIARIREEKLIAIVRGADTYKCLQVAQALYAGGIRIMEIAYDQSRPEAWEATANSIQTIASEMDGRMIVGAGTVTAEKLVDLTYQAGGRFIISPNTERAVISKTRELGMVSIPGAMTPTEIASAYFWGADFVKLFPAGNLGTGYLQAIRAPLNHIPVLAVGGINEDNAVDFLRAGAAGVGVGGNLAKKFWIDSGDFDKLTVAAQKILASVQSA